MVELALRAVDVVVRVIAAWWLVLSCWAVAVTVYERRRTGKLPAAASVLLHLERLARLSWPLSCRGRRPDPGKRPPLEKAPARQLRE